MLKNTNFIQYNIFFVRINCIVILKKIELICNVELRTDRAAEKKLLVSPVTTLLDPYRMYLPIGFKRA